MIGITDRFSVTLYPSNVVTGDPFAAWQSGTLPLGGQQRQFFYGAVGRLIDSYQPEKGWEKNRLYDAWGNLLGWQDQLGIDRNYWLRNTFDVAGRMLRSEKRAGHFPDRSPGAPVSETVSGTGAHTVLTDDFDSGLTGWEEGSVSAGTFTPGPTLWTQASYAALSCIGAPAGSDGGGLYFGEACSYSAAPATDQAVRKSLTGVTRDDLMSLEYFRSTRESTDLGEGSLDQLAIWAVLDGAGSGDDDSVTGKRILFGKSSAQAVYARWFKSPAIRIGDFFNLAEWPEGSSKTIRIYVVFTKGDTAQSGLGSGVMLDDLLVGRSDVETLSEQTWDEPHCTAGTGGTACTYGPETQDRSNGQLTSVRSYQDGDLLAIKRYVFRGLNGRLSGVRSQIDWTGGAAAGSTSTWGDFVYGFNYSPRGVVLDLHAPMLSGTTEARTYRSSTQRDLLERIRHTEADLDLFAVATTGIGYDAAGLPVKIAFANDTTQQIVRDAMHRPQSITSTWVGDPVPIFSTGTYRFDGAGNISSIGDGATTQSFVYDASSRLTKAWMLPRATERNAVALHKIDYAYDPFGNILSQQMLTESPVPPAGFNFTLEYGSPTESNGQSVTNRIKTPGFTHDANGNLQRFRGQYQQAVGAVWDPRNRMRSFIPSDPLLGQDPPVETYAYDAAGYRIVKIDHTGRPMISIRDEQGSALSEFLVEQGASQPTLSKDFLYANGSLLVERTVSPTEPTMAVHSTFQSGSAYQFKLTSGTGHDAYSVDIATASGWRRTVGGIEPDAQGVFSIPETELSPGETNFVRVRIEAPVASGYSAPVSVSYDPSVTAGSANQIRALSVSRNGTDLVLRWKLNQSNGKQTRLYFKRSDTQATYLLTPMALSSSMVEFTLNSQALASPCGSFWGTQVQAQVETGPGPSAGLGSNRPGEQGAPDGCGAPPLPSPVPSLRFVNSYRHLDHLGSLRVARGDSGAIEAGVNSELDLYPFGGPFASAVANSHRQFTGHERDVSAGLDYMLARYYPPSIGRFMTSDSAVESIHLERPQSFNRYSYVENAPLSFIDPTGLERILGIHSNTPSNAGFTSGHAWISIRDTATGSTDTYGLWPDSHPDVQDNGAGTDVRHDLELGDVAEASRYYLLSDNQSAQLDQQIAETATWSYTNTCASWASDIVLGVTGEDIDADDTLGLETPREVTESIKDAEAKDPTSPADPRKPEEDKSSSSSLDR